MFISEPMFERNKTSALYSFIVNKLCLSMHYIEKKQKLNSCILKVCYTYTSKLIKTGTTNI